jgi:hypothetical protein
MSVLTMGSQGDGVRRLQQALNQELVPNPRLAIDGRFGALTRTAVARFQAGQWLVEDGVAGPCTQNALFRHEAYQPILHKVPFIPQPTPSQCWAASTAMMTLSTVPGVLAKTPADMIAADGGLMNSSESDQAVVTGTRYALIHNLRCFAPMSWMVSSLRAQLQRGPLMFDMLWNADGYARGRGSPGHMIVVVGMRGDNDPSGKGTTLRVHDPWPPGSGKKYSVGYFKWIQEVPTRTYRVFSR